MLKNEFYIMVCEGCGSIFQTWIVVRNDERTIDNIALKKCPLCLGEVYE